MSLITEITISKIKIANSEVYDAFIFFKKIFIVKGEKNKLTLTLKNCCKKGKLQEAGAQQREQHKKDTWEDVLPFKINKNPSNLHKGTSINYVDRILVIFDSHIPHRWQVLPFDCQRIYRQQNLSGFFSWWFPTKKNPWIESGE